MTTLKLILEKYEKDILSLPSHVLDQHSCSNGERKTLHFGSRTIQVTVKSTNDLTGTISQNLVNELHLPLEVHYEIKHTDSELILGPLLGILAATSNKGLIRRLKGLKSYLKRYDLLNGVISAFSLEGINYKKRTITGYIYNPNKRIWIKKTLPFPTAIYNKAVVKYVHVKRIQAIIGKNIFTEKIFTKWEMYQLLQSDENINNILPYTNICKEPKDVISSLEKYPSVFLKPLNGSFGKNTLKVTKVDNEYTVHLRSQGENHINKFDQHSIGPYIKKKINKKIYLIQETLPIVFNNKVIDYRLYLSKNSKGVWQCLGWVAKSGVANSIVSNHSSGGKVQNGDVVLRESLNISKAESEKLKETIFGAVCKAAGLIEKNSGLHYGYFGVDVAIDQNKNTWLLEMNHRHVNNKLPLYIGDKKLHQNILTSNMLYLKYLSGF